MLVYGRKVTTYPEYPDVVMYSRYGEYLGQPYEEMMVFVRSGTNGFEDGDPQEVELPDRDGFWMMSHCDNFLGNPELVNSGMHYFLIPLSKNATILTEEEYFKRVPQFMRKEAEKKQLAITRLAQAQKQRRDQRSAVLSKLGLTQDEVEILMG